MRILHPFCFILILLCALTGYVEAQHQETVYLWKNGAPGFEDRKDEPEQAQDWWVKNVHNPSLTVYFPDENIANDTAVLIFPGGGHETLVYNSEGRDPALFLNKLGITAAVLKYRLGREKGSPYTPEIHAKQDAYRAIRLVRSRANEWKINVNRVGVMGFSAGGEVAAMIAYESGKGKGNDSIDKLKGKPDFQILVYPGPNWLPKTLDLNAPPTFMVAAMDDACCLAPALKLLNMYHEKNLPVEAHFYAEGGHGFNMGYRSQLKTISGWPDRLGDWLTDYVLVDH